MPVHIRPLQDHVLVRRQEASTETPGGLHIPEAARERPIQAKVVAVGSGKRNEDGGVTALDVQPGDTVLFAKYSGTEVQVDGESLLIMREADLLAVVVGL
jgi:chaperonin GroES